MRSIQIFLAVAITLTSLSLYGHHSPFIFFDSKRTIEIEGTLSYIKWGNPHPRFRIEARDDNGNSVTWSIEVHSYSILRRMDLDFDVIGVGDTVKIAGWPAVRRENSMFVTNMLLSDGSEIPFYPGVPARYSDNIRGIRKPGWCPKMIFQSPSKMMLEYFMYGVPVSPISPRQCYLVG